MAGKITAIQAVLEHVTFRHFVPSFGNAAILFASETSPGLPKGNLN